MLWKVKWRIMTDSWAWLMTESCGCMDHIWWIFFFSCAHFLYEGEVRICCISMRICLFWITKTSEKQFDHNLDVPITHQPVINAYLEIVFWDLVPSSMTSNCHEGLLAGVCRIFRWNDGQLQSQWQDTLWGFAFMWQPSLLNAQNVKNDFLKTPTKWQCVQDAAFLTHRSHFQIETYSQVIPSDSSHYWWKWVFNVM